MSHIDSANQEVCAQLLRLHYGVSTLRRFPNCVRSTFTLRKLFFWLLLYVSHDASEDTYTGVIYLRLTDSDGNVHVSLVTAKTKVEPVKRLTIPRLELCGAHLLVQLLNHVKEVFHLSFRDIYAWTDSTIVLHWLSGSPRRFKTCVGNRVASIVEHIPPDRWNHVNGTGTQLIVHLKVSSHLNCWNMSCGGKLPLDSNIYHQSGPSNRISLHPMKKGIFAY